MSTTHTTHKPVILPAYCPECGAPFSPVVHQAVHRIITTVEGMNK